MIQRIQSFYMLLAALLVSLLFFLPIAELAISNGKFYIFRYNGLFEQTNLGEVPVLPSVALGVLFGIIVFFNLAAIFLFRNRYLQIRLCIFNIIMLLGSLGLIYFYIAVPFAQFQAIVHYKVLALMPFIAAVLNFFAIKAIYKDDDLIKSIDRIR
jgi:hypothetical protein